MVTFHSYVATFNRKIHYNIKEFSPIALEYNKGSTVDVHIKRFSVIVDVGLIRFELLIEGD